MQSVSYEMSSIGDVLKNRGLQEPPEIAIVKKFIRDKYKSECTVIVREKNISVGVPNAALANTLRHDKELSSLLLANKKSISLRIQA